MPLVTISVLCYLTMIKHCQKAPFHGKNGIVEGHGYSGFTVLFFVIRVKKLIRCRPICFHQVVYGRKALAICVYCGEYQDLRRGVVSLSVGWGEPDS